MSELILDVVEEKDALVLLNEIPDGFIDCVVTDPPYPIDRDNGTGRLFYGHPQEKSWFPIGYADWPSFWKAVVMEFKRVVRPGGHVYIFTNEENLVSMRAMCDPVLVFKSILIWNKGSTEKESFGMGYHYRKSCEFVLLYSNGKSSRFITNHGTLLHYPRREVSVDHPTPKPVPLLRLLVNNSTEPGAVVLDPFMGGGSLAVACKQTGRRFVGCDINPSYVSLANNRLKQSSMTVFLDVGGGS